MSSKVVREKICAYLGSNWIATPILGDENEVDAPPEDLDPWLSYGFQGFNEVVTAVGSPVKQCLRESGMINFNVWVPSGRGIDTALSHAETLRGMFRNLNLGDGVRTTVAYPPEVGIPSQIEASTGNWFAFQVSVEYVYDYQS